MLPPSAFYELGEEGRFRATSATVGPWDPRLQHGSPPAALLVRCLERTLPRDDVRVARMVFEFFGPVPVADVEVTVDVTRPGARIELSRAELRAGGRVALAASVWRIAASPSRVPAVPNPELPPAVPASTGKLTFAGVPSFGYGEALDWRFVEGRFDALGPATVWTRPLLPLVEGETTSPLGRLLLMVDSANGISAELMPTRFSFVPVELTVSVLRHPRTEWVGMRARSFIDPDGIGVTRAELFDEDGYLGVASQTLFVAPR